MPGLKEVVLLNGDAIKEIYGDWLTVIDSVANGEAFIIVRNNSEKAMRLSPGALEIAIRPALCLPRILTPCEVKSLQYPNEKEGALALSVEESEKGMTSPSSFMSWNMNGLSTRMKKADLEDRFFKQLKALSPDVVSLQEVRLACEPDQPDRVKADSSDGEAWEEFYAPLKEEYRAYLTLSASKYGGQAVLVKRTLAEPKVLYNMKGSQGHYPSGRFIKLEFPDISVRSVYVPFNGVGKEHQQLDRRQEWDNRLLDVMADSCREDKARILMGDLNAVNKDEDMTPHETFWLKQGRQDIEIDNRGFGGTTRNERKRLEEILSWGDLSDTYITPTNPMEARYTFRGEGKFHGKGLYLCGRYHIIIWGGEDIADSRQWL
jgi:exodeoxyribonuclease III